MGRPDEPHVCWDCNQQIGDGEPHIHAHIHALMSEQPDELTASIEQALQEMADEGIVELAYDETKGTLAYRLTEAGEQAARDLIVHLAEGDA